MFVIERGVSRVELQFEAYEEDGRNICGITELNGRIAMPPKAWLATVRAEIARIEQIARNAGADELRIAGRNWSRILPGYQPYDGPVNGIRKVL